MSKMRGMFLDVRDRQNETAFLRITPMTTCIGWSWVKVLAYHYPHRPLLTDHDTHYALF